MHWRVFITYSAAPAAIGEDDDDEAVAAEVSGISASGLSDDLGKYQVRTASSGYYSLGRTSFKHTLTF